MSEEPPLFTCDLCGATHSSSEREPPTDATPEELATLKANWERAYERAHAAEQDPAIPKDKRARNWETVDRQSAVYLGRARNTGVWKVPETITTERTNGAWRFCCVQCNEAPGRASHSSAC